ncbi:30S ribosomal protein S3ae [Halobacteriales archaeon QH_8_64_26]|jgi:small subunit ribosomal protein S3Ae|nr:MAG: 30S ribosomal protein S3ae [Halobacteriales archaeon QH_8_64_26]
MSERSVSRQRQQKRWYTVLAPESFDRAELGRTPADDPEKLLGRTFETTLGDLRNDASENETKLTFRITDYGSDSAYTELIRHELTRDYLRSLTRRGASKIQAYLSVRTADDHRVRVQPVALATRRADRSQQKAIRAIMAEQVREAANERSYEEFMENAIEGRLSSAIYGDAKTIYPLRRVEIQKVTLEAHPEEVEEEEETSVDVDSEDVAV